MYAGFKAATLNQTKIGTNPQNAGQCTGLVQYWFQYCNQPFFYGDALNYITNAPSTYYDKLDPNTILQQGDVAVYGAQAWNGNLGHVIIVDTPDGGGFLGYEQDNPPGNFKPDLRFVPNRNEIIGILRIKMLEGGEMLDEDGAKECYRLGLHREPENDQVWRSFVGKRFEDVAFNMRGSQEWLTQNYWVINGPGLVQQLNTKIQQLEASPTAAQITTLQQEANQLLSNINELKPNNATANQ